MAIDTWEMMANWGLQKTVAINGQLVALKVIRLETEEGVPFTAIREASLLKRLKHANIVLLHNIIQTKKTLTFVFEDMHTDLAQYMDQNPGGLNLCNVILFMFQLLRSLAYIHHYQSLHRDLKPQNLLISCLGELIADFGLACAKSIPRQIYSSEVTTLQYSPPDVLFGATDYSSDPDIWSVGCIFVEMIQAQPIFAGNSGTCEQLAKIQAVLGVPTEDTWLGLSKLPNYNPELVASRRPQRLQVICDRLSRVAPAAEDLASRMLRAFPGQISAPDALLHDFFSPLPPQLYQVPAVRGAAGRGTNPFSRDRNPRRRGRAAGRGSSAAASGPCAEPAGAVAGLRARLLPRRHRLLRCDGTFAGGSAAAALRAPPRRSRGGKSRRSGAEPLPPPCPA
ncbi:LOW QUALITY PROTEIN: cyclin-dependent kinase 15 [Aegotheles albertisi]